MVTTIYFVRHAQTENPENIEYGRMPGFKLSQKGIEQAKKLGEFFATKHISVILTSPLERAFETANFISETIPKIPIIHSFDLIEVESSLWQGAKIEELFKNDSYEDFLNDPEANIATENLNQLNRRMEGVVSQLLTQYPGENVICISHEFPILSLKLKLEGHSLKSLKTYNFPVGSVLKLIFDKEGDLKSLQTLTAF